MKKILLIITIITLSTITVNAKTRVVRECKVVQNCDGYVTVLHPNGDVYDFYAHNNKSYKKDTVIKVSFNELKFDKEHFTINFATPIAVK